MKSVCSVVPWSLWYVQKIILMNPNSPSNHFLFSKPCSQVCESSLACNYEAFCFPTHKEPTESLFSPCTSSFCRIEALTMKIFMCIYSYNVPTCGAFSIVAQTTVLKCVWPMYMCNITLEFEYLNQRFSINGALFSPKNNISSLDYL